MTRLPISQIKNELGSATNQVRYRSERIVLTKHDKDVAVLISMEDLALLEEYEDRMDLEAVRAASGEETISLNELKESMGL